MILKSRLAEIMRGTGLNKVKFSEMLDISRVTLDKILNNDWDQIQRGTIVKLCEGLGLGIGDVFYLESESIWERLLETGHVDIMVGGRTSATSSVFSDVPDEGIRRVALGFWDMLAWSELLPKLRSVVPVGLVLNIHAFPVCIAEEQRLPPEDEDRAEKLLESGNTCLIIGCPKTNSVFDHVYKEIVRSQNGSDLPPPYEFRWVAPPRVKSKSSYSLRPVDSNTEQGIYSVEHDMTLNTTPRSLINANSGVDLIDAGILMLSLDYRNGTTVIGFGGLGGPGTVGCVRAFLRNKERLDWYMRSFPHRSTIRIVLTEFRKETGGSSYDDRYVTTAQLLFRDNDFAHAAKDSHEQLQKLMK